MLLGLKEGWCLKPFNPKPRPCPICNTSFVPDRPMQSVCSPKCAVKQTKLKKVEEKAKVRTRRDAIKTIPELIKEAQIEFNRYIRTRDRNRPCICCGKPLGAGEIGGDYDCGHYRSIGSAGHLRFDERNAHAQRKRCNRWGAGRAVDYRIGLIERIGLDNVEALEANNTPHKWTADELREIKATYREKTKQLLKEHG